MTPEQLAKRLGISAKRLRAWLRSQFARPTAQKGSSWSLMPQHVAAASEHFGGNASQKISHPASSAASAPTFGTGRARSDEAYVIDLCDELIGEQGRRQHTFHWLVGDPGRHG